MIKKTLLIAAFAACSLMFAGDASAGDCYYRSGYRSGPVVTYRAPTVYHNHHSHSPYYRSSRVYSYPYGGHPYYRSNNFYRSGYGGYGVPYYRSGTSIGIGRGGIQLQFGFSTPSSLSAADSR